MGTFHMTNVQMLKYSSQNSEKDQEMQANSEYVPSSCNWNLSLQAPKEIPRSKDFIMLDM